MQEEATGEDFNVEEVDDGPRPFSALLDTGLKRTSTGSKVFAALKVNFGSAARVWTTCYAFSLKRSFLQQRKQMYA